MHVLTALLTGAALGAGVAPECQEFAGPPPEGYDEQVQIDFLQNYFALVTALGPLHGPIPHDEGHGAIGLDLNVVPPLGCEKRFALQHSKTEDTNITPLIPRPRITFAFPALGTLRPYAGLAYAPPLKVFGTTNVLVSGEAGLGLPVGDKLQLGGRIHATSQKTVAEIATPIEKGDPVFEDLYVASTLGLDLQVGYDLEVAVPYLTLGWLDASTQFWVGDTPLMVNNLHPYFGPVFTLGIDGLAGTRFRWGGELWGAPGGHSLPDEDASTVDEGSRYGNLITARLKVAFEL